MRLPVGAVKAVSVWLKEVSVTLSRTARCACLGLPLLYIEEESLSIVFDTINNPVGEKERAREREREREGTEWRVGCSNRRAFSIIVHCQTTQAATADDENLHWQAPIWG